MTVIHKQKTQSKIWKHIVSKQ